jgi:hypothetical protein
MLEVALAGVAVAFLKFLVDFMNAPLVARDSFEEAARALIVLASRASVCAVVLWGLLILPRRLHRRPRDSEREPSVSAWNETTPLDAGIFLAGFALGIGFAFLTAESKQPYPGEWLLLDRIGGAVVYGTTAGFLGILASQYAFRGRRESLWTGEWLGIIAAAFLLSTVLLEISLDNGFGLQAFVLLVASLLMQCLLSIMSAGFLLAKLFTRHRPGPRVEPPRTDMLGYLACAMTGPIILWRFLIGLAGI